MFAILGIFTKVFQNVQIYDLTSSINSQNWFFYNSLMARGSKFEKIAFDENQLKLIFGACLELFSFENLSFKSHLIFSN